MAGHRGIRQTALGLLVLAAILLIASPAGAVVTANVSAVGFLQVTSNADDDIAITCVGGDVKINGGDPSPGATSCGAIKAIFVGGGPGANHIDLSAVTTVAFPNIQGSNGIFPAGGADTVTGSAFRDYIGTRPGSDTVDGGGDIDLIQFFGTSGNDTLTAMSGSGSLSAGGDTVTYTNVEQFTLSGLEGADTLNGAGSNDTLSGGAGDDILTGGGGDDSLDGDGNLLGQDGNDTIDGGVGNDHVFVWGSTGNDTMNAADAAISAGGYTDTHSAVEMFTLLGLAGDDTLTGAGDRDFLSGGDGNDTLSALDGHDVLDGGSGNDTLSGGAGNDGLIELPTNAAPTNDHLDGGPDNDYIYPGFGTDVVRGGPGDDTIEADLEGADDDDWDGQTGSDDYVVDYLDGTRGKKLTIADLGPSGAQTDTLVITDCAGVTVTATEARKGTDAVSYAGVETLPCGGPTPQPPPPEPQPPAPPQPAPPPPSPPPPPAPPTPPPPPAPQPSPKPKAKPKPKKVTLCHKGHTIKVVKSAVKKHRKHGDKLGKCKPKKKRR